jgi:SAM-dependent methyltransferase
MLRPLDFVLLDHLTYRPSFILLAVPREGLPLSRDLVWASAAFRHELTERAQQRLTECAPDRADLSELLRTYLNEIPVALELLSEVIGDTNRRILEVGSGTGAVALCLAELGYDITGIEPGGPGFEDLVVLQGVVCAAASDLRGDSSYQSGVTILQLGVDDLDPEVHGRFDVVFSANVLEHVPDPVSALELMQSVLAEGGVQRHVSPNYAFPYEPHFSVPLLPIVPFLTTALLSPRITETGLWKSLNFVTARQVQHWARSAGVEVRFDCGVLAEAVERFLADEVFAERHAGLSGVVRVLQRLGAVPLLRRLPVGLVSPMRFTIAASVPRNSIED